MEAQPKHHVAKELADFPTINLGPLFKRGNRKGIGDTKKQVYAEMRKNLCKGGPGFFLAKLPQGYMNTNATYKAADRFFSQPDDTKQALHVRHDPIRQRGWSPRGNEPLYVLGEKSIVETFTVSAELPLNKYDTNIGPNVWPKKDKFRFKATVNHHYQTLGEIGSRLFVAFAEMLNLPRDTFSKHASIYSRDSMRLLHYTPGGKDDETGFSEHTDFECFTLLQQNSPGLHLQWRDSGEWVKVPVLETDETIIFCGDILERWTNGTLKATRHRVVKMEHERLSISRFCAVDSHTVIAPLSAFGKPLAKYPETTMGGHMQSVLEKLAEGKGSVGSATQEGAEWKKSEKAEEPKRKRRRKN